jgi:hypothetical protein
MAGGAVGAAETVDGGAVGDAAPGEVRLSRLVNCFSLFFPFQQSGLGWGAKTCNREFELG